jgi:hypothetical protein
MITSRIFKLYPYVNNSFDETLKFFVDYITLEFDVIESNFTGSIIIDNTKIGNLYSVMKKPDYIYITICFCTNGSWSNSGGLEYCKFNTESDMKIYVRWDTNKRIGVFNNGKECEEINNNFFRKIKLEKLKKYDTL